MQIGDAADASGISAKMIRYIRELLQLWNDRKRPSREVKRVALEHIADMEAQIRRMRELVGTLRHFADACEGDSRPHCPILDELAGAGAGEETRSQRRRLRH